MKVKICGITNTDDALLCQDCGADALGFIFYKGSKRYIEPEKAAGIIRMLSPFTMKAGVFVNESAGEINRIASLAALNVVQLHSNGNSGQEEKINYPVIESYRIKNDFDFSELYKSAAPYFLLDSHSDKEYGGTGKRFDWQMIPPDLKSRIILAGGVSVENLEEIVKKIKPAAIDLSSSLESEPGRKDKAKVKEFFDKYNSLKASQC